MKILVVGASGYIGSSVVEEMKDDAEIITAGRNSGDHKVDITSPDSIKNLFEEVGEVDALVCAAGGATFKSASEMEPDDNKLAVESKLLGQINLVLLGQDYINDNGSITLVTGILMDDAIKTAASAAMANGGVRSFIQTAAIELPRGLRINNVSPTMVYEAEEKYGALFKGVKPREAKDVGLAFKKSILGGQTGQTYEVY